MKTTKPRGGQGTFRVLALLDDQGVVKHVESASTRRTPWRILWRHRETLPGELCKWFRSLSREPREIVLLGSGSGLTWAAADGVVQLLKSWFPCLPPAQREQPVRQHKADGTTTIWPTTQDAAKALGIKLKSVYQRIFRGKLYRVRKAPNRQIVGQLRDGAWKTWPTAEAAARALGISSAAVNHRLAQGTLFRL
jgi:hypothetical protein